MYHVDARVQKEVALAHSHAHHGHNEAMFKVAFLNQPGTSESPKKWSPQNGVPHNIHHLGEAPLDVQSRCQSVYEMARVVVLKIDDEAKEQHQHKSTRPRAQQPCIQPVEGHCIPDPANRSNTKSPFSQWWYPAVSCKTRNSRIVDSDSECVAQATKQAAT